MGGYGSQYEEYYRNLKRKGERRNLSPYLDRRSKKGSRNSNHIGKRIIRDLVGTLVLFLVIILCKLIVTPKTQAFYNYSKSVVNKNYDYKKIYSKVKSIKIQEIEREVTDFLEGIKNRITGDKSVKETTLEHFIYPVKGKITSNYGYRKDPLNEERKFHEGVDIAVKENTDVKASYDGKIKYLGEDEKLGKYVVIDHKDGIETKYAHLNSIEVKKGEEVSKGYIIGKSGNTGKSTSPHLHFEFIYMGESKNPEEFISQ